MSELHKFRIKNAHIEPYAWKAIAASAAVALAAIASELARIANALEPHSQPEGHHERDSR